MRAQGRACASTAGWRSAMEAAVKRPRCRDQVGQDNHRDRHGNLLGAPGKPPVPGQPGPASRTAASSRSPRAQRATARSCNPHSDRQCQGLPAAVFRAPTTWPQSCRDDMPMPRLWAEPLTSAPVRLESGQHPTHLRGSYIRRPALTRLRLLGQGSSALPRVAVFSCCVSGKCRTSKAWRSDRCWGSLEISRDLNWHAGPARDAERCSLDAWLESATAQTKAEPPALMATHTCSRVDGGLVQGAKRRRHQCGRG